MKGSALASRLDAMNFPLCEAGELLLFGNASVGSCACTVQGVVLEILVQTAALPDALHERACECGHPEMRRLPDEVFHCPACDSEVLPLEAGFTSPARIGKITSKGKAS